MELKIDQLELSEQASDLFIQKVVGEIKPALEVVAKELKQKESIKNYKLCYLCYLG